MRYIWIGWLLALVLQARENPFVPVAPIEEILPVSSNEVKTYTPLEYETFVLPDSVRAVTRIIVEYQNLDGSIDQKVKELDKSIDWHEPIVITHKKRTPQKDTFGAVGDYGFISFKTHGKVMKIQTKNSLLRHFMLAKPHRVVMDFARTSHFLSKQFKATGIPYTIVRIGNHKDYYRVVVELDGQYEYKLEKAPYGFELTVK